MPAVGEHHGTCGHPAGVPAALDCRRGRAGFKCCRWCDKSTACKADKTIMFREIPAGSVFFGAGAYWRGPDSNGDVLGSGHANSRFLCNGHDKVRQKQEPLAETSVHLLHTTPKSPEYSAKEVPNRASLPSKACAGAPIRLSALATNSTPASRAHAER